MRIRSLRQGILLMPRFFDRNEGEGLTAVIQFKFNGAEPGLWHLIIRKGECILKEGEARLPVTLTVSAPSEVWLKIMRGEINGPEAFLSGEAAASGDMALLLRLGKLFSQPVGMQLERDL